MPRKGTLLKLEYKTQKSYTVYTDMILNVIITGRLRDEPVFNFVDQLNANTQTLGKDPLGKIQHQVCKHESMLGAR